MKLGSIVRIKKNLKIRNYNGSNVCLVTHEMKKFAGEIAEIVKIDVDGTFYLDVDNCKNSWCEGMVVEGNITDDELQYQQLINNGTLCCNCGELNENLVGKDRILKEPLYHRYTCPKCLLKDSIPCNISVRDIENSRLFNVDVYTQKDLDKLLKQYPPTGNYIYVKEGELNA
ncbi:MAG: hypothetical protein ACI4WU_04970 [Bacilli bacterium]